MSEGTVEAALREWDNAKAAALHGFDSYDSQDGGEVDRLMRAGDALAALRSRGSSDADEGKVLDAFAEMWPDFDFGGCYDLDDLLNHARGQLGNERNEARNANRDGSSDTRLTEAATDVAEYYEGKSQHITVVKLREALAARDPDYSPAYQDEYQRLWHKASGEVTRLAEALRSEFFRILPDLDYEPQGSEDWAWQAHPWKALLGITDDECFVALADTRADAPQEQT